MGMTKNPIIIVNAEQTLFKKLVDRSIRDITAKDLEGVTEIGAFAFRSSELDNIELPDTIQTIRNAAFYGCTGQFNMTFGSGIKTLQTECLGRSTIKQAIFNSSSTLQTVGNNCFYYCTSLEKIVLPSTLTYVGNTVLTGCQNIKMIIICAVAPPTLQGSDSFNGTSCPIYVPTPDDYKIAQTWINYTARVFPLVSTVAGLANIDTTAYTKACVIGADESYKEYTYDGSQWNEVT